MPIGAADVVVDGWPAKERMMDRWFWAAEWVFEVTEYSGWWRWHVACLQVFHLLACSWACPPLFSYSIFIIFNL